MSTIMRKINILSRCEALYRTEKLPNENILGRHHSYILAICKKPGLSQEELAKTICVNKSNITRTLSYLEEHGYVERCQDESDKRVSLVFPTEKMLALLPKVRQITKDWNSYIIEELSDDEKEIFQNILDKITKKAHEYIESKEEQNI